MRISDYIKKYKDMTDELNDFIDALRKLRGGRKDWESNISEDKRKPVILLYSDYLKLKRGIKEFENMKLTEDRPFDVMDAVMEENSTGILYK